MAVKQANPWSIKGIRPDTRETAKEAARRAGMTVGQWLNTVIQQSASELSAVRDRAGSLSQSGAIDAADPADGLEDHFQSIELRLSEMAQQLRSVQSLGAVPTRRDPRAPVPTQFYGDIHDESIARLEGDVMEMADAIHALNTRFERSDTKTKDAWSAIEAKLSLLDGKLDGLKNPDGAGDIDSQIDALDPPETIPELPAQQAMLEQIEAMRGRLDAYHAKTGTQAGAREEETAPLTRTLSKLVDRLDLLEERLETPNVQPDIDGRIVELIDEKLGHVENSLHAVARSLDPDLIASSVMKGQAEVTEAVARQQNQWEQTTSGFTNLRQAMDEIVARQAALEESVTSNKQPDFEDRFDKMARRLDSTLMERQPDLGEIRAQMDQLAHVIKDAANASRPELDRLSEQLARMDARVGEALSSRAGTEPDIARQLSELAERMHQPPDPRVDTIQARLDDLTRSVQDGLVAREPGFDVLGGQLNAISDRLETALASPPSSGLELDQIDTRLRAIAERIDRSFGTSSAAAPSIVLLESKLNAISDRIEAVLLRPESVGRDTSALEARLEALGEQLENSMRDDHVVSSPDTSAIEARIDALGDRLENSMRGQTAPVPEIGVLQTKLDAISEQLDRSPPQRQAAGIDDGLLNHRLSQLTNEIRSILNGYKPDTSGVEDRISELVGNINANAGDAAVADPAAFAEVGKQLGDLNRQLESLRSAPASDSGQFAVIEERIAAVGSQIEQTQAKIGSIDVLGENLSELLAKLDATQSTTIEAAREAARGAVAEAEASARRGGASHDVLEALQTKIAEIHDHTAKSDLKTRETLSAVHDTLEQVVSRMRVIETGVRSGSEAASKPLANPAQSPVQPQSQTVPQQHAEPTMSRNSVADTLATARRAVGAETVTRAPAAATPEVRSAVDAAGPRDAGIEPGPKIKPGSKTGNAVELPVPERKRRFGLPSFNLGGKAEEAAPANEPSHAPASTTTPVAAKAPPSRARMLAGGSLESNEAGPSGSSQTDFIAAARRAAQAAAMNSEPDESATSDAEERGPAALRRRLSQLKKPALYSALALLLVYGGSQLFGLLSTDPSTLAGDDPTALDSPAVLAPASVDAEPLEPFVEESGGKVRQIALPPSERDPSIATDPVSLAPPHDDPLAIVPDATEAIISPDSLPEFEPSVGNEDNAPLTTDMISGDLPPADLPADRFPEALREAAIAGDPHAQFEVGARYSEAGRFGSDLFKATEWYSKAAGQGLAPAQYRLGSLYEKGQGVEQNTEIAKLWYERGAMQGNLKAMHNLAVLLASGKDGTPDYENAARWFHKAAQAGLPDSQYNLGILRARGLGLEQNMAEAYKWFSLAAEQGDRDAAEKRDQLTERLDEETRLAAKLSVQRWQPAQIDSIANQVSGPEGGWGAVAPAPDPNISGQDLVREIQSLLTARGYQVGTPDGLVGPKTAEAVKAFQREAGIPETGAVTTDLYRALMSSSG